MFGPSNGRGGGALAAPAATPTSAYGRGYQGAMEASDQNAHDLTPWVLVAFIAVWLFWTLLEQHQRLRNQVQPKNIAMNVRSLLAVGVMVVLFYALARVGLVKLRLALVWLGQRLGGVFQLVIGYLVDFVTALIKVIG